MTAHATAAADANGLVTTTERDNVLLWDRSQVGHYEVYYLTFNDPATRTGFWIRYTLKVPYEGEGYAQLWFAFFDADQPQRNFALNRIRPLAELDHQAAPFRLRIGAAELGHDHARGELSGAGHAARWDLSWQPAPATHHHLPGLMYRTRFADTRVLSPNLDIALRGTVEVDGRTFTLQGAPGDQTHVWGRKHAHAWGWGHCNAFEGRTGAVFEILTGQLRKGSVVLPQLTAAALYLDGETIQLTDFAHILVGRAHRDTAVYRFSARGIDVRLTGEFHCRPEDMVCAEYTDPDGAKAYCHNTEVAELHLTLTRRSNLLGRWVEQARLRAAQTAHFEIGRRTPDPAIAKRHITVP